MRVWPFPQADTGMVQNKNVAELQAQSALRDSSNLKMGDYIRGLLEHLEKAMTTLGESIPVIENRSVCFYNGSGVFFAEMLPMAYQVRLLMPLSFDEVGDDPEELAVDATIRNFVANATHRDCGVVVDIRRAEQLMPSCGWSVRSMRARNLMRVAASQLRLHPLRCPACESLKGRWAAISGVLLRACWLHLVGLNIVSQYGRNNGHPSVGSAGGWTVSDRFAGNRFSPVVSWPSVSNAGAAVT